MMHTGGCLCGGVRYQICGHLAQPVACHCSQCARTSGNYAVMARYQSAELRLTSASKLTWFRSSEAVQRGFCGQCGGNIFWRSEPENETYVAVGTLDPPTGLRVAGHIFVGSKSDFYDIVDDLPQKVEW